MAVVGGTASKLGGGKFSNGAVSGAFVHMFNAEGMARSMVNGTLNVVGKVWNSLNTAIGLVYGGIGYVVGLAMGTNPSIGFGHNAIEFTNNPFGGVGAITLGNTITYGTRMTSSDIAGYYGSHEQAHTYQGEILGPLYLVAHGISMLSGTIMDGDVHGSHAFMETGPMDRSNPRPWY